MHKYLHVCYFVKITTEIFSVNCLFSTAVYSAKTTHKKSKEQQTVNDDNEESDIFFVSKRGTDSKQIPLV